jgi:hypothetical protein
MRLCLLSVKVYLLTSLPSSLDAWARLLRGSLNHGLAPSLTKEGDLAFRRLLFTRCQPSTRGQELYPIYVLALVGLYCLTKKADSG